MTLVSDRGYRATTFVLGQVWRCYRLYELSYLTTILEAIMHLSRCHGSMIDQ